jgi:hypothetical protein
MRVEYWNPNVADETFENVVMERLVEAANVIKLQTRINLREQIGQGKTTGISRPVYKKGRYAGAAWTARNFGELIRSIRVVRKKTESGRAFSRMRNVRVYAGHTLAYYADIFEFYRPFMKTAVTQSMAEIKSIIGAK